MSIQKLFILLSAALALLGTASAHEGRTRESFNTDWRFERFGPMPDASSRPEPGAAGWAMVATASSQEADHGNPAANAMDGDQLRILEQAKRELRSLFGPSCPA